MKKFLFVFVFIVGLVCNSFAQKSIDQLNGFDWMGWDYNHKAYYVQGFFGAQCEMMEMIWDLASAAGGSEEQLNSLMNRASDRYLYTETISVMVEKMDAYYASPSVRKYNLHKTIPYLAGKNWWNSKTGEVESSLETDTLPPIPEGGV